MDETFARVSKAGRVICGKAHSDGGYYCDEPLAEIRKVHTPPKYPERVLTALPGWRADRKGIWRQTTSVSDRRAHGRAPGHKTVELVELPALVCCPKCATLQWLDAERLNVRARARGGETPANRWVSVQKSWQSPSRETRQRTGGH